MSKRAELIGLLVMVTGAVFYLFGPSFTNPNAILFSNDGPLGVMSSQHIMDSAVPGSPHWDDLHWLGMNGGVTPASPSYLIIGLMYSPLFLAICITACLLVFCLMKVLSILGEFSNTDHPNKKHL